MHWRLSHRADPRANILAKRHYSCQSPDSRQFVKPGRCLVLGLEVPGQYEYGAVWATSWPYSHLVKHQWPGAWENSLFRNESQILSSSLITEAIAITRWYRTVARRWMTEDEPHQGMITFIDPRKVKEIEVVGWCYRRAKFKRLEETTKDGKLVFHITPRQMPEPMALFGQVLKAA